MPQKISFTNSKHDQLAGVLHTPNKATHQIVIIAHGFTSNKDRPRHIKLATALAEAGIAAFRFDFGGSGDSQDRPITIEAQIDDLRSTITMLQRKDYQHFGVMGESLGGLVTLSAFTPDIQAMVLWAPVTTAIDKFSQLTPQQQTGLDYQGVYYQEKDGQKFTIPRQYLIERAKVNPQKIFKKITIPVMIVHGTADQTIPLAQSEEAITLLPKGSKLEAVENWEHGDDEMEEQMDTIIPLTVNWFTNHL